MPRRASRGTIPRARSARRCTPKSSPVSPCRFAGRRRGRPRRPRIGGRASTVTAIFRLSCTVAADKVTANGMPWRSTPRWRFVPDWPRSVGCGPVGSPPGSGDASGVNRRSGPINLPGFAELVPQHLVALRPHPGRLPGPQPPPAGQTTATTHFRRHHLPRDAAREHEHAARAPRPIRLGALSALGGRWSWWQQRFDESPQLIRYKFWRHTRHTSLVCPNDSLK